MRAPAPRDGETPADAVNRSAERMLLALIDGRRGSVELESLARALHLGPCALQRLHGQGLIGWSDAGTPFGIDRSHDPH